MLGLATLLAGSLARSFAWSAETPPAETPPAEKTAVEKTAVPALSREQLDWFERELRPLVTVQCLGCHGPKKQEAGLRLDQTQSVYRGGDRGPAIAPDALEQSLILQAVRRTGDLKMPPDRPLTAAQIATLETWLKLGAYWPATVAGTSARGGPITDGERRWWSLQPLTQPAVPALVAQGQAAPAGAVEFSPRTAIDQFVAAKWQVAKLQPVGLTDRRSWLRRATVDLTGLPPTVEQLREFASDDSPDAAARVIDRLLAAPAYGERYGRHWLDVVRYADTAGDGADYPVREAYRYRDYVVRSFNHDKPYDEFLREQIAGDLLPVPAAADGNSASASAGTSATSAAAAPTAEFTESTLERYRDQVTATGFLAVSKRFGYNLNNEFQHLDLADALEGLGRSVLGLSLGCARCHDHKYDPISAADYYAWYGILQSSQFTFPGGEELKQPRNLVPLLPPALVTARQQAQQLKLGQLDQQIAERQQQLQVAAARLPLDPSLFGFENQTLNQPPGKPWFQAGPNQILAAASSPFTHLFTGSTRGARIGSGKPNDGLRLEFPPARKAANSPQLHVNIDFRSVIEAPGGKEALGGNEAPGDKAPAAIDAANYPGSFRLFLSKGVIASMGLEFSVAANELMVKENQEWQRLRALQPNTWYSLQVTIDMARKTYSGRVGREGDWFELTDRKMSAGWNGELDTLISDGLGHRAGAVLPRDLDNIAYQSTPFVAPNSDLPPTELQARRRTVAELETQIQQLQQQKSQLASEPLAEMAYGVTEGRPKDTQIQKRGEPDRLGEVVPRRNLEILGGELLRQPQAGSGRLDLAHWLTSPTNPLTARVLVNRLWQWHFGAGIVATASDFGTRGELPSHPELLDYLAQEFLRQRWSMKGVHRELMLSAVYGLSDTVVERNQELDPKNRLLTRFTRRPLDAESIRDSQLMISGELDRRWPGAHPFPPVMQWNFTIHYPFTADYDSAHRSLYLMVQRQRKHPYLSLFDGADPNISTSERLTTITPTQALYLLNSPFVHAQAAALAQRLLREHADDDSRLRWVWEATTSREPESAELVAAQQFLAEYQQASGAQASGAQAIRSVAELEAAWAALARVLLTSNGLLFVD
ncbi:MAG: PSD1 and planctomycete cytochrome C domain-containing protein [Planctomycetota bacterium]